MVRGHGRAQRLKALDVLVDGAVADGAAPGIGDVRLAEAPQHRADKVIAGAQPPRVFLRHDGALDAARVDGHGRARERHLRAQRKEDVRQRLGIAHKGQVFDGAGLVAEQHCRNDRERGVFAAVDGDRALQPLPAGDPEYFFCHVANAGLPPAHLPIPCSNLSPLYTIFPLLTSFAPRFPGSAPPKRRGFAALAPPRPRAPGRCRARPW